MSKFDCQSSKVMANNLIAPNGKPSNLSAEQYALVRTPEFKAWFGDWENEYLNRYNIFNELTNLGVTEDGEPRIWYHARDSEFYTFDRDAAYFAETPKYSQQYGEIVKPFFVKCKNTLNLEYIKKSKAYTFDGLCFMIEEAGGELKGEDYEILKKHYQDVKEAGGEEYYLLWEFFTQYNRLHKHFENWLSKYFDSIYYWETGKPSGRGFHHGKILYIFGDVSARVKLADGSNTTFDAANPDIRYADGGELFSEKDGLYVIIKDVKEENKYKGAYKNIFDIIEEGVSFYNPYGADYEEIIDGNLHVHITPRPELNAIEKIKRLAKVEVVEKNYADGGETSQDITCINCGWHWNTSDSDESDKYVCHKCGFDNKAFYDPEPIGVMADGGSVGDFKKVKKNYLGIDESFEDVEYRYKDAAIRFNGIDNLWILTMQQDGKPEKTIGGYKTLKIAKEVGLYYLKNPKLYADGGKVDFGEVLFGEDKAVRALQPKGLTRIEPNTEDENKLQKALYDYTQSSLNKDSIIKNKSLLESAANQFPQLLRPKISPFDNNFLFRGVSFSEDNKDNIIKMLGISIEKPFGDDVIQFSNEDSNEKNAGSSVVYGKYFQNADFGIKDFEFTSWTTDYKIAKRFNRSTGFIYAVSFEKSDDLYLRPKLSNAVSSFRENEMLFYNEGKGISTKRVDKDSILVRYIYILYSADNLARLLDTDIYTVRANINARPILEGSTSESALQHDLNILNKDKLQEDWFKKGGLSRTPAPKKDRVFGSDKNKVGSAASKESAKKINLSEDIITTLSNKAKEYNEENSGNKVTLNTLKAVMRRGMGAYSTSHRPTITGGAPNSRQAWGFARVNKFLKKKSGEKVKAAYVQDDDLLEMGGTINKNNLKMIQQHYHSMKPIEDIQVGDIYVIKEDMFAPHQDHEHPQHLSTRYATVEVKSPCHRNLDSYTLEVMDCDCDNAAGRYAKGKVIERSRKHILSSGKLKSAVAKATEPTEKVGLDDIYMGDSINYDGKTYEVGGLSDCRTKLKIKLDDNESDADIDDVMDRAILIKRGN